LRLLAEGGKDARGRIRINTVLVCPVDERGVDTAGSASGAPGDREPSGTADGRNGWAAERREGSDVAR
jgi:hypothetical protein